MTSVIHHDTYPCRVREYPRDQTDLWSLVDCEKCLDYSPVEPECYLEFCAESGISGDIEVRFFPWLLKQIDDAGALRALRADDFQRYWDKFLRELLS